MRYIKFIMSKGDPITLPEDKALSVIKSQDQIVCVGDENGNWTGITINKAHIVDTIIDNDAARAAQMSTPRLEEAPISEEQRKKNLEKLQEIKKNIFKKL